MLSLILVAALNTAAAPPPAKAPQREAGTGCGVTLQLAADGAQPPQPAPCPKPYLVGGPARQTEAWPPASEPMPNLYSQPARCGPTADAIVQRMKTSAPRGLGGPQYAVMRVVDGCALPTPISYHPDYLLPGAADPTFRRGDAPADRR